MPDTAGPQDPPYAGRVLLLRPGNLVTERGDLPSTGSGESRRR